LRRKICKYLPAQRRQLPAVTLPARVRSGGCCGSELAVRHTRTVAFQKISAVVFDLGGVLIDWDPRYLYRQLFADHDEMERFLGEVCTADWHRQHDLGADVIESCRRLARLHPMYAGLITAWAERSEEMAIGQIDQTVDLLRELKAAGMRCYALSNMEAETFTVRRERFGFMKLFDGFVISGLERVAKPDPQIFRLLLERYGLAAGETIFIDDSMANVEAAEALGLRAIHFTSAQQVRSELRRLGVQTQDTQVLQPEI
jgi:2-haloacid dehalogenase